ncbi:MAG: reverse transcriptase family protein [Prosthecobacter sp.]|uniref:reverse transcriptase family protein n=1 Tax=Prosthecobacter sp. TaxID=1965333 RepID=UPI003BAE3609
MGLLSLIRRLLGRDQPSQPPPLSRPDSSPRNNVVPQARATPPSPIRRTLAQLDSDVFAGISGAETKQQAKAMGRPLWSNLFAFGRQSVIPPVTDARTLMIDRAMVGEGLITPEELKEIHEIGQKMDELRPGNDWAQNQGTAAVMADKAAKAELKRQKKAEAAKRQEERAAGIAHRKATDIIFLGRGVSGGLADRRSHVEKLQEAKLPVLSTPAELATALELPVKRLRWLAFHAEVAVVTHYIRFQIPKKSGGVREISTPHTDLARAQRWILQNILERVPVSGVAHGFVRERGTLTNARSHTGKDVVLNADLKDFFPSITFPRVRGIFQQLGYSPAVATMLALLCTECPRRTVVYDGQTFHVATGLRALPQGACTSPALSNLCARKLDLRFAALAAKHGWTYTRYADDLTFSSRGEAAKATALILSRLHNIVKDEHFEINEAKTRIQRRNAQQSVTGVVVNDRCNVDRKTRRRLRAILHQAKQTGIPAQNRIGHDNFAGWVSGMLGYVKMINPQQGEKLFKAWDLLGGQK